MVQRLRLISGLVLFAFVLGHFVNHALGLVSLAAANRGLDVFRVVWHSVPGTALLAVAFLAHLGTALWSVARRRSLRLPPWEWAQLALGLTIPLLLADHVLGTRGAIEAFGMDAEYRYVQHIYWVAAPWRGALQAVLLLVVWVHACICLHYWLCARPWYERAVPVLYAGALLVPALALAGFVSSGAEVVALAGRDGWLDSMLADIGYTEAARGLVETGTPIVRGAFLAVVAAAFGGRWLRALLRRGRNRRHLIYTDGPTVDIQLGATVLEMSRAAGIPHASVCGGHGRCSTCRVRVGRGGEMLPPPSAEEAKVLHRIGAPPNVRLACQIRPCHTLQVTRLLPAGAGAREGFRRPGYLAGDEREIAILFADLRGFTRLSDTRLPFDVVFVLNRYFAAMGGAIEGAGGRLDKFIGDGVMALFGIERGPADGCRRALAAARAMAAALDALNQTLADELPEPLRIGIGIHVGPAIVGEMGYGRAKSVTAIGDAVNTASRLEGLCKSLGAQLVVSEAVAQHAGIDLSAFEARATEVRGKRAAVTIRVIPSALDLPEAPGAAPAADRRPDRYLDRAPSQA